MKILHVDTGREMRGGQYQALYLVRELAAAGHTCTLLARPPLLDRAIAEGLDARPVRFSSLLHLSGIYDLVHAHDARAHTLAAFAQGPLVVSRRVAFPIRASAVSRWKYSRPSRYIAVSNYVRSMLVTAGVPMEKIDTVHDGVLPSALARHNRVVALDSDDPAKGRALIQEAAQLAKVDVHFAKDLAAAIKEAKLFIYITSSEGLGSGALLAMAAGVPVLASAVGGLPEIVEDGVTGFLTSNAPEQIADNMLRALANTTLLDQMGKNACARVRNAFTTQHMMRSTIQAYEKVIG